MNIMLAGEQKIVQDIRTLNIKFPLRPPLTNFPLEKF